MDTHLGIYRDFDLIAAAKDFLPEQIDFYSSINSLGRRFVMFLTIMRIYRNQCSSSTVIIDHVPVNKSRSKESRSAISHVSTS